MSVCVVSFSSRKDGNCSKISEYICSTLPDVKQYNFSNFTISPCGKCNYQCFLSGDKCPYYDDIERELLDSITHSELTYFIVPNYCDYPCSNFFIFNERSVCYFQNNPKLLNDYLQAPKKFIVVSNSDTNNFVTAFSYQVLDEPKTLLLSAKKYNKNSIDGDLLTSEQAVAKLQHFLAEHNT